MTVTTYNIHMHETCIFFKRSAHFLKYILLFSTTETVFVTQPTIAPTTSTTATTTTTTTEPTTTTTTTTEPTTTTTTTTQPTTTTTPVTEEPDTFSGDVDDDGFFTTTFDRTTMRINTNEGGLCCQGKCSTSLLKTSPLFTAYFRFVVLFNIHIRLGHRWKATS